MKIIFPFFFVALTFFITLPFIACKTAKPVQKYPTSIFDAAKTPPAPDYADLKNWAAHPDVHDCADSVPVGSELKDEQAGSQADVFFIHPTTLLNEKGNIFWNSDVGDTKLNRKTDASTILYQASIFNGVGKIYAPRYRQAHIHAYFTTDTASARRAFDLAYGDVKASFEYYLKNRNNGRPIIIAAHSQGTTHAKRLIKEFFEGKTLKNKLVVAYLVGIPVAKNLYTDIKVCETPEQTGCICSWRTFRKGYEPPTRLENIMVVNPLSMRTDTAFVGKEKSQGAVLLKFKMTKPHFVDAQIHNDILWTDKPKFFGSIFFNTPIYHIADYNFFYLDVRNDVKRRLGYFWKQ